MSEPTATTDELEFDARRYIDDREYRAQYDVQEWQKRSPEAPAFHRGMQRQSDELEKWIEAGMRLERREEVPAKVISIAMRQPV